MAIRRPLFWTCLFLSVIAILYCRWGDDRSEIVGRNPFAGLEYEVPGKVCKIERKKDSVYVWLQIKNGSEDSFLSNSSSQGASAQDVAFLQRIFPSMKQMKTDKVRCELGQLEESDVPRLGSHVVIKGVFSFYPEATNPGEFNTAAYYQGLRVGGRLKDAKIIRSGKEYDVFLDSLFRLRELWAKRLDEVFPEREVGVMQTMLLGEKANLDGELKELYREGGILHILSISGLHVTLLGMGLYRLLRRMGVPIGVAVGISSFVLVPYGIMTGMSVSAFRAIGMFLLRMLAELCGRTYDLLTGLALLAAIMLCTDPLCSMESGFWLSFGAIAGIGILVPVMEGLDAEELGEKRPGEGRILRFLRRLGSGFGKGAQAGYAVFLATLPVVLTIYYEIPVYAMLVNLLVIPTLGVILLVGFLVMLVPFLGFLSVLDVALLRFYEGLCTVVRNMPFHSFRPGCPMTWQVVLYYLLLAGMLGGSHLWKKRELHGFGWCWKLGLFLPVLLFLLPVRAETGVTFLDVGQGDCACIRSSHGKVWLCDCGSSSRNGVGEYILLPYLKHEGITKIDGIFLSHADQDHVGGIAELLSMARQEGIQIEKLILPALSPERIQKEFKAILAAAGNVPGLVVYQMGVGDHLDAEGIRFLALHPTPGESGWLDSNEASLCLYMTLDQRGESMSGLFLGDVEGEGEACLIKELKKLQVTDVTLLKCAHHGSKNATSEAFLEQVAARIAVISCGRNNVYGHPHEETLDRLSSNGCWICRTDQVGCVTLKLRNGKVKVDEFCSD